MSTEKNDIIEDYLYSENGANIGDEDNYLSLDMFSKDFDNINLVRGTIDNIWYVELLKNNDILWSSVLTCNLVDDMDEELYNLCNRKSWNIKKMFGNETNMISRIELQKLIMEDGIKEKSSLDLFTSIGLWKSLFLTLNYCEYIMKKREIIYSQKSRNYIIKYNNRRETIERRKKNVSEEYDRMELINNVYTGIQNVFNQLANNDNLNYDKIRITYKEPFYWPSVIPILYILERIGKLECMLLVIEYISEVKPEIIFEFANLNMENNIIRELDLMNNECLQCLSMCFQEYLSDLLSIAKKSISIMSSYIKTKNKENILKENEIVNKEDVKNNVNLNLNNLKKKPNYMRPTRLSELRKQQIKKNTLTDEKKNDLYSKESENKTNRKFDEFTNEFNELNNSELIENMEVQENKNLLKENYQVQDNDNFANKIDNSKNSTNILEDNNGEIDKFNEQTYIKDELEEINDPLEKVFTVFEEKSKITVQKMPNFDDELSNIIQEIDNIKMNGLHTIKDISTNISDDYPQNLADSIEDKYIQEERAIVDEHSNEKTLTDDENLKSPFDPYDWYYTPNNVIQVNEDKSTKVDNLDILDDENDQNKDSYYELKYIESILDKEIEELQKKENELVSNIFSE